MLLSQSILALSVFNRLLASRSFQKNSRFPLMHNRAMSVSYPDK